MKCVRIHVRGVVQGVGFRPFVYGLALENGLSGWVRNTSGSVEIEVEGAAEPVDRFVRELEAKAPPMARIEDVSVATFEAQGHAGFEIRESLSEEGRYQLVSPDIATCSDCLGEILSTDDRRYRYPFTNCTNCGPRFTIIEDIPYDRPKTTMRRFKICPDCQSEYDDPLDRRFHAQPNACPKCGPSLLLTDSQGANVDCDDAIQAAAALLREGKVLAVKGLGGFLVACDATDPGVVTLLRERKRRGSKPFAVMMTTLDEVREHCLVSTEDAELLTSPQAPILLLPWKDQSSVCREVAPGIRHLGVMLSYTPLHHLLMRETGLPLVMTSGNLSEEPIAKDNDEALARLGDIADYFLLHNRDIYARYDDSVFEVRAGVPQAIRRARGYAPYPVFLPFKARQVLACGAEEKNTFCLTREEHAFVSQHIGDMENEETLESYLDAIKLYQTLFRVEPEVVAYDMHPEYLSTKYAMDLKAEAGGDGLLFVPVQHHHAHLSSCLAENQVTEDAIGVVLDGTGYGTDGTLWGGDFLFGGFRSFTRMGHLEYVPMPGGAAAIAKPYRMALGYVYSLLGPDASLEGLPLDEFLRPEELGVVRQQLARGVNCPLTTSAGRLFDAVSALVGVRGTVDYQAQAAIELEALAPDDAFSMDLAPYPFGINAQGDVTVVRLGELVAAVVDDVRDRVAPALISARFHLTMARLVLDMCRLIAGRTGVRLAALSGGVFQNRLLHRLVCTALKEDGFRVLTHRLVPCNDGGISLGQAVIAHFAAG